MVLSGERGLDRLGGRDVTGAGFERKVDARRLGLGVSASKGAKTCFSLAYCLSLSRVRGPYLSKRTCISPMNVLCHWVSLELARADFRLARMRSVSSCEKGIWLDYYLVPII